MSNLTLVCLCCNKIKLNVLTYEDMRQIGQVIRKRLLVSHNCNMAKGLFGECPHDVKVSSENEKPNFENFYEGAVQEIIERAAIAFT